MVRVVVISVDAELVHCRTIDGHRLDVPNDTSHVLEQPALLAIAELEDDILLVDETSPRAIRCRVVALERKQVVRLTGDGLPGGSIELPIADLGLVDFREALRAQNLKYLVVNPGSLPLEGLWDYDGGLPAWRLEMMAEAEYRRMAREADATRRQAEADERLAEELRAEPADYWDSRFVNPYTFVPFPADGCAREEPVGHASLATGRMAGSISITWEVMTPLLVRGPKDDVVTFPTRPVGGVETPVVPGSSVKGSVRSLHETLAGGCLRVLDADYLPVYRDHATVRGSSWSLGRVDTVASGDGRPLKVTLCDRVVWVMADHLHKVVGGPNGLRSGIQVDVLGTPGLVVRDEGSKRDELVDPRGVTVGTGWVVLVTDAAARSDRHPYWCATGRLSAHKTEVTTAGWDLYQRVVDGSNDVRVARGHDRDDPHAVPPPVNRADQSSWEPVIFPKRARRIVGYRRTAARRLAVGDVIWVRPGREGIDEIALSALWRREGEQTLGERLPDSSLLPCSVPDDLCVSCRLFGSADSTGDRRKRAARQDAYRGHVRVGDAVANRGARVDEIAIAPLGVPRPGAGQFYLRHTNTSPAQAPTERPTREWGARPDTPVARSLKGRKYYWHGDPAVQTPPRHIARLGQADTLATRAEVVNPTATFTCRLTFENLTRSELGGLLAALDPARALDAVVPAGWSASHQIAGRLGGGKPLGLGSVQVNGLELELHSAGGRYLVTGDEKSPSIDDLIADFVTAVPKSVAATWPDLAAVLDIGHVKPEVIWYPPALPWSQSHEEKFEPGFEFWKASAGRYLHPNNPRSPENIIPLKEPRDPDQYLDIVIGDGH